MSNYKFKHSQRYAVFSAFEGICQWCKEPVVFKEFDVDHVLPEDLLTRPAEQALIFKSYGLDTTFNINDYENWTVLHGSCNQKKSAKVYEGLPLIKSILNDCEKKKPLEQKTQLKLERDSGKTKVLSIIGAAIESGITDFKSIQDFILGVDFVNASDTEISELALKLQRKIEYQTDKMIQEILSQLLPNINKVLSGLVADLGKDWSVASIINLGGGVSRPGITIPAFINNKVNAKYSVQIFTNGFIDNNELILTFLKNEAPIDRIILDIANGIDWKAYRDKLYELYKAQLSNYL